MQKLTDVSILYRIAQTISLYLLVMFIIVFNISCQSQTSLSESGSEVPKEPVPEEPSTTSTIVVVVEGFAFKPAEIIITAGSTIVWNNKDSVTHTITAVDKSFDSGSLPFGGTFSHTFNQKGTFEYSCVPHPYMKGKVEVE